MAGNCSCPFSASYLLSLNSRVLHRSWVWAKTSCSDLPDLYVAVGLSQTQLLHKTCHVDCSETLYLPLFTYEEINLFQCSWACHLNAQSGGINYQFCTSTTGSNWRCAGTHRSEWITRLTHGSYQTMRELPWIQPKQYLLACSVSGNHHLQEASWETNRKFKKSLIMTDHCCSSVGSNSLTHRFMLQESPSCWVHTLTFETQPLSHFVFPYLAGCSHPNDGGVELPPGIPYFIHNKYLSL